MQAVCVKHWQIEDSVATQIKNWLYVWHTDRRNWGPRLDISRARYPKCMLFCCLGWGSECPFDCARHTICSVQHVSLALLLLLLLFYSASIMDSVLLAGLPHDYLRMVESKNRSSLVANNSALSRCFRWQRYPSKPRNVNQLLQTCLCAVCCLHAHAIEHCKWAIPVAQRTYLCICSKSSGSNIRLGCAIGRHHCRRLRQMQLRPRVPT